MVVELNELVNKLNFKKTRNKIYTVYWCIPRVGKEIKGRINSVKVTNEKPVVISEVDGELKTVGIKELFRADMNLYRAKGSVIGSALKGEQEIGWKRLQLCDGDGSDKYEAALLPIDRYRNLRIKNSYGKDIVANDDRVKHPHCKGDYLVFRLDADDDRVVSSAQVITGAVFERKFNMRYFRGSHDEYKTPEPFGYKSKNTMNVVEEFEKLYKGLQYFLRTNFNENIDLEKNIDCKKWPSHLENNYFAYIDSNNGRIVSFSLGLTYTGEMKCKVESLTYPNEDLFDILLDKEYELSNKGLKMLMKDLQEVKKMF